MDLFGRAEQTRAQIALTCIGQNDKTVLARALVFCRLQSRPGSRAAGLTHQESLLHGQRSCRFGCILICNLNDLIVALRVQDVRREPGTDALDGVFSGLPA